MTPPRASLTPSRASLLPSRASLLALALLLAACQAPPAGAPAPKAEAGARKAPARAAASKAPEAGTLLRKPAGATRALQGQVRLDAAYLVGTGAGALIGADAASLVGNNGNTLIGNNGNTLVGNNGNTLVGFDGASAVAISNTPLVAAGAGNAIAPAALAPGGAGLVGNNGNTLVGFDGASLVGMGGGLVGNNGNTLVGNNGNTYALAQAPHFSAAPRFALAQATSPSPAGAALAAGTALPAAGMLVAALSLADGKPLAIGEDGAGQPVYAVYTDAAGRYEIYPPAEARGNLRVVAIAGQGADQRLRYGVFAAPGAEARRDVSEPAAIAASYLYLCVLAQLDGILRPSFKSHIELMLDQAVGIGVDLPEIRGAKRLEALAIEIGYEKLAEAERQALLRRVADIALSGVDFAALTTTEGEPALPVLEARLQKGADDVAALMAAPPAGKTARTMFDEVPSLNGFQILRPADFNEFVVTKIIAVDPLDTPRIVERIGVLRLEMGLEANGSLTGEIGTASYGIANEIGAKIFAPDERGGMPVLEAMEAAMRASAPAKP